MKTLTIIREYVEATQRGYIVGVHTTTGRKIDLVSFYDDGTTGGIDAAYAKASEAAEKVAAGVFVCDAGVVFKKAFKFRGGVS